MMKTLATAFVIATLGAAAPAFASTPEALTAETGTSATVAVVEVLALTSSQARELSELRAEHKREMEALRKAQEEELDAILGKAPAAVASI